MKNFADYLTESKKTYEFKIGIAGPLPEGCVDKIETALKKFNVVKMTSGKKTPIQENPLDFPKLQNMEVTYWDTEIEYPTTSHILEEYLSNFCNIPHTHVIVRNANDPRIEYQKENDDAPYETMLTKEDMGGESAQKSVGGNRVMDLLKELESARKERDHDGAEGAPKGESKDIGDAENSKAVVGG